ncbi:MAG: hypothetical protein ACLVCH_16565 [Roseburia inulinivorans]
MKSKYIRAICLGAAGLLVISTAAINNHKQSEDVTAKAVATASVIDESAETADAGVTAGIASVTAQALASNKDVATVSDTDTALTAADTGGSDICIWIYQSWNCSGGFR